MLLNQNRESNSVRRANIEPCGTPYLIILNQFSSSSLVIRRAFNSGDFEILVCIGLSILLIQFLFLLSLSNFYYKTNRNESDIILIENNKVIKDRKNVANTLNEYFISIAEYTAGRQITALPSQDIEISISKIINKYENHISIQNIRNKKLNSSLTFEKTT